MTKSEMLFALAAKVAKLEAPSFLVEQEIADAIGHDPRARLPNFTASLDAAVRLVPEGYDWCVFGEGFAGVAPRDDADVPGASKCGATPVLSLAVAALRARADIAA